MRRLFISFSGGETSAFMAQWLLNNRSDHYDEIICLFANTGQENEETLRFVRRCDEEFGLNVVWLEAEVKEGRARSGHRIVSYETASRNGEPFEAVIQKYGIPNQSWPHCTRELKLNPMMSYLASIGWEPTSYDTAIGIRADEVDRISPSCREKNLIYPLISDIEMTKPRINAWWSKQPFRLRLKGYEGNCKWCWKKSLRKHLTLLTEHPEWYNFPEHMERLYTSVNPKPGLPNRVFFREGRSTQDLRALAEARGFTPAHDEAQIYEDQLALELDASNGCSESCEINFEEVA